MKAWYYCALASFPGLSWLYVFNHFTEPSPPPSTFAIIKTGANEDLEMWWTVPAVQLWCGNVMNCTCCAIMLILDPVQLQLTDKTCKASCTSSASHLLQCILASLQKDPECSQSHFQFPGPYLKEAPQYITLQQIITRKMACESLQVITNKQAAW